MSNDDMSAALSGSVMTALRNVEPALNRVAPWRSMIDEKRPACGNSGEPSATMEVMPKASGAAIK